MSAHASNELWKKGYLTRCPATITTSDGSVLQCELDEYHDRPGENPRRCNCEGCGHREPCPHVLSWDAV